MMVALLYLEIQLLITKRAHILSYINVGNIQVNFNYSLTLKLHTYGISA